MSRLQVPLLGRTLYATGDLLLRAELDLLLKDRAGNWQPETFRFDTGSEMTTMPAARAKQLGLPMPPNASPGVIHQPTGLEVRSGYLRMQVTGMDATEYGIPCFFLGDPHTPPSPTAPPGTMPRNLLGMAGVVEKLRFIEDGTPTPTAPWGTLTIEKLVP